MSSPKTPGAMESDPERTPLLKPDSLRQKRQLSGVSVEPVALLHSFGWSLSGVMLTDQIMYQSCEPYAATVSMSIVLLTSVIPALMALGFGPWSDRYGRKPIIAFSLVGFLITDSLIACLSYLSTFYSISPWCYVLANIPVSVLGGYAVLNLGIFSVMNDITNEANRTVRMGILQGFIMCGVVGGLLVSSFLGNFLSVSTMFCISALATIVSLIYLYLGTEESVNWKTDSLEGVQCNDFFNLDLLRQMLTTLTQRRPNRERPIMWLLMAIGALIEFASSGRVLFFLYTRQEFNLDAQSYSLWLSAELSFIMLGNMFGISFLKKIFKCSDIGLMAISTVNHIGDFVIKGMSTAGWQLYLASALTPFKGIETATIRSIISNILPSEETAKMYALDVSIQAVTPIGAVFFFTFLYQKTLKYAPATYLYATAGVFGINLVLVGFTHALLKTREQKMETTVCS
ncbi:tetracycline resistance protein, class E-like isoform X2 [Uranotaenia lowii]|uniref:tetracycline resistance protein, class E-like isoform X2 n=1 Tax=Uranotaenia lowii TaxID=190385 RepID=UPI00247A16FC|nr:tetracycline resistance protein, class E-like isoform X2 [Uranotaenia lowii]